MNEFLIILILIFSVSMFILGIVGKYFYNISVDEHFQFNVYGFLLLILANVIKG